MEIFMSIIKFDESKELDLVLLGRVAVDLNPLDYNCPLSQSTTFKRYLGGSPANIAVGTHLYKVCFRIGVDVWIRAGPKYICLLTLSSNFGLLQIYRYPCICSLT